MSVLPLVACALALPFFLWGFRTYQLAFAASHAIAILGLNLVAGQAGVISLGHGAFYGLGAYAMAVLMRQAGASAYAGILAAPLLDFVAPESFTYWLSILFLVGSVFGGMTSVWGALAGGLFLQFWPDLAGTVSRNLAIPVFGALLVLSAQLMPGGVAGIVGAMAERLRLRR